MARRKQPNIDSFLSRVSNAIKSIERTLEGPVTPEALRLSLQTVNDVVKQVNNVKEEVDSQEHATLLKLLQEYR